MYDFKNRDDRDPPDDSSLHRAATRRRFLRAIGGTAAASLRGAEKPHWRISVFEADVTPPLGTPFLSGVRAVSVVDPLFAKGFVLSGAGKPLVLASIDWCEIRNGSYHRWRQALAETAGTTFDRVLLTCVHQHDAPYVDEEAQRLLEQHQAGNDLCHPQAVKAALANVVSALRTALRVSKPVTSIGIGQGKTKELVSNRRYVADNGKVSWSRTSATRDPALRAKPEGLTDPWVKTLSFWDGDQPLAAVNCFSTHPMSYYGKGHTSADFVGMARSRRQKDTPGTLQIYVSGCSGDTIAGKYNDGSPEMRPILADRLYQGMVRAWKDSRRMSLEHLEFRSSRILFKPRRAPGYSVEEMRATLAAKDKRFQDRYQAALGLSWRERLDAGNAIDVPCIDFGKAQLILLPAESFVQYQLWAQEMRPDSTVLAMGYGECAPGYIPTAKDAAEGYNDHYSWIAFPECEQTMLAAIREALRAPRA